MKQLSDDTRFLMVASVLLFLLFSFLILSGYFVLQPGSLTKSHRCGFIVGCASDIPQDDNYLDTVSSF